MPQRLARCRHVAEHNRASARAVETIDLAYLEARVEPISRTLSISAQGTATGEVDLPLAGHWTLVLNVLVSDFEKVMFHTEFIVQEERGP
jgi:copper transport protein